MEGGQIVLRQEGRTLQKQQTYFFFSIIKDFNVTQLSDLIGERWWKGRLRSGRSERTVRPAGGQLMLLARPDWLARDSPFHGLI